jgi:Tol biopolymer transport system component
VSSPDARPPYQSLDILRTGSNVPLTWSVDGRAIDAVDPRDQNVWRYPLDGGKPSRITQFTGGSIRAFAWSWDGQRFAVSHGSDRADVVLITEGATR